MTPNERSFEGVRVAVIFDNQARPDTTGGYCLRALEKICEPTHILPQQVHTLDDSFDLYLNIDDSLRYLLPRHLRPAAFWVIDTHLQYAWDRHKARIFDAVFAAQKNGAQTLREDGIRSASWLPLACDPEIHRRNPEIEPSLDVVFVGNIFPGPRQQLLEAMASAFPSHFIGRAFFEEMSRRFSTGRILVNQSIRDDINMRVFEAAACERLLLTNDLSANGQEELLRDGEEIVTYRSVDEAIEKAHYYLQSVDEREQIAARGGAAVRSRHTYQVRMETILQQMGSAGAGEGEAFMSGIRSEPLTSILVLAWNQEKYNRICVESIRRNTRARYELILIDNGSTDGTLKYFRTVSGAKVLVNKENLGFAAGFNRGLDEASGDFVVLLNNDTVVTEGWLEALLAGFAVDSSLGVLGPTSNCISGPQLVADVPYKDEAGLQEFARRRQALFADRIDVVPRITGFCMALTRDLIDRIGLLDTRFGVGNFEDDDYCLRARLAGFKVGICPASFVHHYGSVSFRASGEDYQALLQKNQQIFREKWAALGQASGGSDENEASRPGVAQISPDGDEPGLTGKTPGIGTVDRDGDAAGEEEMLSPKSNAAAERTPASRTATGRQHFQQAEALWRAGDLDAAGQAFLEAAQLLPDDPLPRERLATLLLEGGAAEEAAEVYAQVVAMAPASANMAIHHAIALAHAGRHREALAGFERCALHFPLAPSERTLVLGWAADTRLQLEDASGATQIFSAAIALAPEEAELHDGLGRAHAALGDMSVAADCFRQATQLPNADPQFFANLAAALWSLDEREAAFAALQKAIEGGCTNPETLEDYAAAAIEIGQRETARATLQAHAEKTEQDCAPLLEALAGAE
jgi:GT2 family glycosyltransferase/Flp pilus assembly protein TadD